MDELSSELGIESVSNSAFTQRRALLKHGFFIELNQKTNVEIMYREGDFKRYKGLRLLAIDGSKVRLPETEEVKREFGEIEYKNQKKGVKGKHCYGLASVMHDVLNKIAIDSHLGKAKDYEVDLGLKHLEHTRENDVLICDRNYPVECCSTPVSLVVKYRTTGKKIYSEMFRLIVQTSENNVKRIWKR